MYCVVRLISTFRRGVNELFAQLRCCRSVHWWLVTDVSGQPIGPIFNDQAVCRKTYRERHYIGPLSMCFMTEPEDGLLHAETCCSTDKQTLLSKKLVLGLIAILTVYFADP